MVTVTQAVLAVAGEQGGKTAVADAADGRFRTYGELAALVPAAAAGLVRRGLRPGDVAAVHLSSACDHALATHALSMAGAVCVPLDPAAGALDLAEALVTCEARLMVTEGGAALEAVERSHVRQLYAFDDVPSATPFDRLVADGGNVRLPAPADDDVAVLYCDEADTPVPVTHGERIGALRAMLALGEYDASETVVADLTGSPARARTDLIDLGLLRGVTLVGVAEPDPAAFLRAVRDHRATVALIGEHTFHTGAVFLGSGIPRQVRRRSRDHTRDTRSIV